MRTCVRAYCTCIYLREFPCFWSFTCYRHVQAAIISAPNGAWKINIYIYCSLIRQFLASMLNFGGANPSGNSVCDDLELPTGFKLKQHHQCSKFLGPNTSKSCLRGSEALWDCLVITTQACCSSIFEDISLICMALFLYQPFTIFFQTCLAKPAV